MKTNFFLGVFKSAFFRGPLTLLSILPANPATNMNRVIREVVARFGGAKSPTLAIAIENSRRYTVFTSTTCPARGLKCSHHAEERACSNTNKRIKVLVVIRFNGSGELVNANPCMLCCRLVRGKCRRVFCSNRNGNIVLADLDSQFITSGTRLRKNERCRTS